jgi:hypothetical protein
VRDVRDPYLPPDHEAFVAAEPPGGRIIVIAPTRAACETIELGFTLDIETLLWREHAAELTELAKARKPFGVMAGTGTGKTLSIKPIAHALLGTTDLRVGVINREREAPPEAPSWNVVIVTTGIARRWFQDNDILARDTLVVDEVHQTSAELELCLALGKRVGCRFIWLSATVDPSFYARYLNAAAVVQSTAFDPARAATVKILPRDPLQFLDDKFMQRVIREKRGVGVFLPTRAMVEQVAADISERYPRLEVAHYHGGEPIRVIRPFLEGGVRRPFVLTMTAAGQSALNVQGLDTVVIDDSRFANVIERGRNVLTKLNLGANEILQMAGRVHGRVHDGRVFILSDRVFEFASLRPVSPDFQLSGDSERVALTCAALGVRADELDLPVPLDRNAYRAAVATLDRRGVTQNGILTKYGKAVEAMPCDRPWAELLVHADDALLAPVAVMSGIESLHRMTREDRNLEGLVLPGSDHLTSYNVYAEAFRRYGYVGEVYGLPRHLFNDEIAEWAERRGILLKSVEDASLAMASVFRAMRIPIPSEMSIAKDDTLRRFQDLLARVQPFSLVIDEHTANGEEARVSKTSVCGSWGAIAGTLRYFADRFGTPRAAIEGTQIPRDLIRKYAVEHPTELVFLHDRAQTPLVRRHRVTYFDFELEREDEPVREWSGDEAVAARRALAGALAGGAALHPAVRRHRPIIDQIRESWRRSGGRTIRLDHAALVALYESALAGVDSVHDWRASPISVDWESVMPASERAQWMSLPGAAEVRDRTMPLEYDVESGANGENTGIARLRIPEKLAHQLEEDDLPVLDRPLRFTVSRGPRGTVTASTLEELRTRLSELPRRAEETGGEAARRKETGRGRTRNGRRHSGKPPWKGKPRRGR